MSCLRLLGLVLAVAGIVPAHAAATIDDAREARWAAEIVPALVVGDAIDLAVRDRKVLAIFTDATGPAKGAIVLVHGLGVHPDFGIVGELRTRLAEAGFRTLAVQMPVLAADADRDEYAVTLPEAGERIAAALAWLRARGDAHLTIVSHSLGAAMTNAYLARDDAQKIDAWVAVGMAVPFAAAPREPVLDVLAASELPAVMASAPQRARALPKGCSRQITVRGADHYFEREGKALAATIAAFLNQVLARAC